MIQELNETLFETRQTLRRAWADIMEHPCQLETLLRYHAWGSYAYQGIGEIKDQAIEDPYMSWEDVETVVFLRHNIADMLNAIDELLGECGYD